MEYHPHGSALLLCGNPGAEKEAVRSSPQSSHTSPQSVSVGFGSREPKVQNSRFDSNEITSATVEITRNIWIDMGLSES
jgi:hypothetical protein